MTFSLSTTRDPHAVVLRRGIIAAVCGPIVFALGLRFVEDPMFALFACFACFAVSGLVWFGGPTAKRSVAYVGFTITGTVLVALGTFLSNSIVGGVVAMLLVGFLVRFVSVFGRYIAAGANAVLLAFVLPVMVVATPHQYVTRLTGWIVGCAVAIVAVLVFVHDRSRQVLRADAADICRDIAEVIDWEAQQPDRHAERVARTQQVVDDVRKLRKTWAAQPFRPAGPTLVDQAFLTVVEALHRMLPYLKRDLGLTHDPEVRALGAPLRAAVVTTLHGAADLIARRPGDPSLLELDDARVTYRRTLARWVAGEHRRVTASRAGGGGADAAVATTNDEAELIVGRVEESYPLLVVSHQTVSIAANAFLMQGQPFDRDLRDLQPDVPEGGRSVASTVSRANRVLRSHLRFDDLTFRVAVRTGVVLAIAVYLADLLGFGHKFWVVLGALTVLRTSAVGTGASGVQALAGTAIGFVLSGLFVQFTASSPSWLWVALIVSMFLAAYAPTAISFTIGQASFTLFVVVLFTILEPSGWATGVQRVEAMAAGIAVAVLGGVALWPRGAKAVVGRTLADFYRVAVRYLDVASYQFLQRGGAGVDAPRAASADARWSADDAFNGLVGEQRTESEVLVAWIRLLCLPASVRLVADAVSSLAERGYPCCDSPSAVAAVRSELERVEATVERAASRLLHPEDTTPISWGSESAAARTAVVDCLAEQLARPPDDRDSVLGLLFVLEALSMLDDILANLGEPLDEVCADLSSSAWR